MHAADLITVELDDGMRVAVKQKVRMLQLFNALPTHTDLLSSAAS